MQKTFFSSSDARPGTIRVPSSQTASVGSMVLISPMLLLRVISSIRLGPLRLGAGHGAVDQVELTESVHHVRPGPPPAERGPRGSLVGRLLRCCLVRERGPVDGFVAVT